MEHVGYEEFMEKQYQRLKEKSKFVPLDAIECVQSWQRMFCDRL